MLQDEDTKRNINHLSAYYSFRYSQISDPGLSATKRVYAHKWTPGDAVVWDNRCLLHQARPGDMDEPRIMYHARIAGDQPQRQPSTHLNLLPSTKVTQNISRLTKGG